MRRLSEAELNVLGVLWKREDGFVLGHCGSAETGNRMEP